MRILLVSWYFPPCNSMGALRIGKLAKHLLARGHDVRVLCARDQPFDMTMPVEAPPERLHYTPWLDANGLPKLVQRARVRLGLARRPGAAGGGADGGAERPKAAPGRPGLLRRARDAYTLLVNVPDPQIGWLPFALGEGGRLLRAWRPDVIFASAPPYTGLIAAARLARRGGVPWVAEYRDRWAEEPYWSPPAWRRRLDRWLEDRAVAGAAALVTVSEPWAEDYRRRWGKPVAVVYNGYDPDDFPARVEPPPSDPDVLGILYTGILYGDRRDPSPLFEAIASLGADAHRVRVDFYGPDPAQLAPWVARYGVAAQVRVHDPVTYAQSTRLQMESDVLLLMQWNDPRERGNVPGKLFEYIGARRPVLGLGYADGVPARLLRERDAGAVINEPGAIAAQLRTWIAEKRAAGAIPLLPESARAGLSRPEQFAELERFLEGVVAGAPARPLAAAPAG